MKKLSFKKLLAAATVFTAVFNTIPAFAETEVRGTTVYLDRTKLTIDGVPSPGQTLIFDDKLYIPLSEVAEQLGLTAVWDQATNTANITMSGDGNQTASNVSAVDPISSTEPAKSVQIDVPQLSLEQILIGEWYSDEFGPVEEGGGRVLSYTFYPEGTATELTTHYENIDSFISHSGGEEYTNYRDWELEGNVVALLSYYEDPDNDIFLTFRYEFTFNDDGSQLVSEGGSVLSKTPPVIPSGVASLEELLKKQSDIKGQIMRKLIGNWYFDATVWNFAQNGEVTIDMPAMGASEAQTMEFNYELEVDARGDHDAIVSFDFNNGSTGSMFYVDFGTRSGGSATLTPLITDDDSILLTRQYDITNNPITAKVIDSAFSVFDPEGLLEDLLKDSIKDVLFD